MPWERSENAFRRIVNPRAETHGPSKNPDLNGRESYPRTGSPSLRARLASDEAACFLPASALHAPRSLATPRRSRRAMRSIDVCHPNETACTRTSCVPGESPRLAPRARPRRVWALREHDQGRERFTTPTIASAGPPATHHVGHRDFHPAAATRGLFDPRRHSETVPLTPLSLHPLPPSAPDLRPWVTPRPCSHGTRRSEIQRGRSLDRLARALVKGRGA